ncbi:uncharacterized protein [Halyomorpha halys]|uniref:uncharacterized protein n=1 Tax=Halyomorpha halys TaxID=286706 RepID=UPI0034D1D541
MDILLNLFFHSSMSCEVDWAPPSHTIGSHVWVDSSGGDIPPEAVKGGQDADGGVIYVGRALHEADILPAKVCPNHGCAFVSYNGEEHTKTEYQVLCSSHIAWKPTGFGYIPGQAIQIGKTSSGEPLYVGRTIVNGFMTPGKIHPTHECLYVPFGGEEKSFQEYEVLILRTEDHTAQSNVQQSKGDFRMSYDLCWVPPSHIIGSHNWVDASGGSVPSDAVKGGQDADGGIMYVGRAYHEEDLLPAKVCPTHGCAFVAYDGQEHTKTEYQVLCSSHIAWKPTENDNIPEQAIQVGKTSTDEPLYVGRTIVNGFMTPGKVHPSHRCLYVPFDGEERSFTEYEVLILY